MKKTLCLLATLAFLLAGCGNTSSETKAPTLDKDIAILYTNDVHCQAGSDSKMGYSELAKAKKDLLAEGDYVTLVDSGDAIQGGAIGTLSNGSYIVDIMNEVGYEVAIPGNHEFDYGVDNLITLSEKATYDYVSCNFVDLRTSKTVFKPYVMKEYDDVKVAYLGITTPKTITSASPAYFQDEAGNYVYGFCQGDGSELITAVQASVDAARAEGAEYVIALSHLGATDDCSPYRSEQIIAGTNGIDAMLDRHSHTLVECERVKNKDGKRVLLSQTGTAFQSFGMLYLTKEGSMSTGLISSYQSKDEATTSCIATIESRYESKLKEKVGTASYDLTILDPSTNKRRVRNGKTNMGDLSADSFRAVTDSDIAFVNAGGVRASIKVGEVTCGDIITVMPFNNTLCKIEASGQQILDGLEMSCRLLPEKYGGFLQVSGLSFEYDRSVATPVLLDGNGLYKSISGDRRVRNVKVGTESIDATKTYTLASTVYTIKKAGDGYTVFQNCKLLQDESYLDKQALIDYIKDTLSGTVGETYKVRMGRAA